MSKSSIVEKHLTDIARSKTSWFTKISIVVKDYKIPAEEAAKFLDKYRLQSEPSILNDLTKYLTRLSNLTERTWKQKINAIRKAFNTPLIENIELLDKYCTSNCTPTYKTLMTERLKLELFRGGITRAVYFIADEFLVPINQVEEVYYKYILGPIPNTSYKQLEKNIKAITKLPEYTDKQKIDFISKALNITTQRASNLYYTLSN